MYIFRNSCRGGGGGTLSKKSKIPKSKKCKDTQMTLNLFQTYDTYVVLDDVKSVCVSEKVTKK